MIHLRLVPATGSYARRAGDAMPEELLTIKQAALLLGVSEQTLRRWDRSGKLRPRRHQGNRYRLYDRGELAECAEALRRAADLPSQAADARAATASRAASSSRGNLPQSADGFVGRDGNLTRLGSALEGASLVTVLGPPGIGKTRLAVRWAELRGAEFRDDGGVWFCDVTHATTVAELCAALARVLAVPSRGGAGPAAIAPELARRGRLLCLIDNAEVLEPAARKLLADCALAAPSARMLVTSRERLDVPGELVVELGPLALPSRSETDPTRLASAEAVRLFRERAVALGGDADDLTAVAELCRALDGIPLAIELAAARSRLLAPREISARLGKLDVLSPSGGRVDRHATLRAAIDWSWQLLSPHEKRALAQCSVFEGGFTPEAAENILDLGAAAPPVLDVLSTLRDKSLIVLHPLDSPVTRRLDLYATIAAFASEQLLAMQAREATELRHAGHFLERAGAWGEAVRVRCDPDARVQLSAERDNLRAVLDRASATRPADAVRALLCLEALLATEGRNPELEALAAQAAPLPAAEAVLPPELRAQLLRVRAGAIGIQGRLAEAIEILEEARALAAAHPGAVADATAGEIYTLLGVRYRQSARHRDAELAAARSVELLRGWHRLEGFALACFGLLLGELGRDEEARAKDRAALALFRRLGDRWAEGLCLGNLAQLDQARGRFDEAAVHYVSAIEAFGDDLVYVWVYRGFAASLEHERGRLESACALYEEAVAALARCRAAHVEGIFRAYLGAARAQADDEAAAIAELDRAEVLLEPVGAPALHGALQLLRGQIDALRARRARAAGDAASEAAARAAATARLEAASRPEGEGPAIVGISQDVRFAHRLLAREMDCISAGSPGGEARMRVGAQGYWFALPPRARVSLARRGPLRRLLVALVDRRLVAPGKTLGREELLEAGWPGERMHVEAGSRRVRVAVATLRSLGLRQVLVTRDDGYLLDPATAVELER